MTQYECKTCGAMVAPGKDGEMYRSCEHKDHPIIASLRATVYGEGKAVKAR